MQFKEKRLGLCLFNILFLSSDLLYVSEMVFICIFYNKYVWELFCDAVCQWRVSAAGFWFFFRLFCQT